MCIVESCNNEREGTVNPMRDYPSVTELVTRARRGDKQAWDENRRALPPR